MSVKLSDENKERILQFIDDNVLERLFTSSFIQKALQDLKNNNELNEDVAITVLEEIYKRGSTIRDVITPNKEFSKDLPNLLKSMIIFLNLINMENFKVMN